MPRREWSRPFPEVKARILGVLADGKHYSSEEIVQVTGLPFEDVISALRLLRHSGDIDFDPEWESEGVLRAAREVHLRSSNAEAR
jgi:hypothetical protein